MRYKYSNWLRRLCAIFALLSVLVIAPAALRADEPQEKLDSILQSLETLLTGMALSNQLGVEETSRAKAQLAAIYQDLQSLSALLREASPPGEEQDTIPVDEEGWVIYENASSETWPEGVAFTGWSLDAGIELGWGDYGELLIEVTNSYYGASWSIKNAYSGGVEVNIEARREGDIVVFVSDREGNHEYKLDNGGLGQAWYRQQGPVGNGDAGSVSSQPANGDWSGNYHSLVASGQIEDSPAMQWFIDQTESRSYESDGLRDLGNLVESLTGDASPQNPIGLFVHYIGDKRNKTPIPDPRADAEGFAQIVKLAFILQQTDALYRVEQTH